MNSKTRSSRHSRHQSSGDDRPRATGTSRHRNAEVSRVKGQSRNGNVSRIDGARDAGSDIATASRDLKIKYRPIESLKLYTRNPRIHSKKQLRQIAESMRQFGFTNPILIDDSGGIIAGHGRVAAAKLLGMQMVPTIQLGDMTEAQKRAYILADNKLAENAGWDPQLLALELHYLMEIDIDFDITITGFDTAEIDLLIQDATGQDDDPAADNLPEVDPEAPPVSRLGDLWRLGNQRLLCGDATEVTSFKHLMADKTAQMVFTDPPYNLAIDGHVCGLGGIRHRDFVMASGEMSEAEFAAFLTKVLSHLAHYAGNGSIHFICMDWRHLHELLTAGRAVYTELKNLCVWNKDNGGMGTFYRSKHELVFVFKSGTALHINNFELGQHGRYRTNVWDYAGVNTLKEGRHDELEMHPTVKPVAMVADAILDCSRRGGIILDCFAGSGTTLIAAEKTGRRAYAMEIDPRYVDTAIRRWEAYTGGKAVLAKTGETFTSAQNGRSSDTRPPRLNSTRKQRKSA